MSKIIKLTPKQAGEILDKGFCYIEVCPGNFKRFTKHDIHISKKDVDKLIKHHKNKNK